MEDCAIIDSGLFLNEETALERVSVGDEVEEIEVGQMACTDHDLTGQVLAAASLSDNGINPEVSLKRNALSRLAGLVASRYAARTLVTDGNDVVLRLLEKNCAKARLEKGRNINAGLLRWGLPERTSDIESCIHHLGGPPDVLLGADVVQWPESVVPLIEVVENFLKLAGSEAFFACGLVARSSWLRQRFLEVCSNHRLHIQFWNTDEAITNDPILSNSLEKKSMEVLILRLNSECS
ncbi:hypothetical protein NDN08_000670 [Rhodosorus marinus]|uniref:Calmodulin-lysine N-methyltransferase n=1 Tax=Rhodosorus marinus TaxID=101924 RepID=A0AAV8UNS1_9RHOD|nr:hypothetical protein NDN08_000670 [Rhodosorus marinus]